MARARFRPTLHAWWALLVSLPGVAGAQFSPANWTETRVSTWFQVYVPPNNTLGSRHSAVVITAQSGSADTTTRVTLTDDDADGDDDDTTVAELRRGESLVRYIRDGAVNDDAGGRWDGDYFTVSATRPVSVLLATDSDWQHDWAPATNGTLRGRRFYLYSNWNSVSDRDINVFAYDDGTRVALYDVTVAGLPRGTSGVAQVGPAGAPLLVADLNAGQDLGRTFGLGEDLLAPGRTYALVASQPVTVQYGAIGSVRPQNQARDGGGFVPGQGGQPQDDLFYFAIPTNPGLEREQELRVVALDEGVTVALDGWLDNRWTRLETVGLDAFGHYDRVGGASLLYRLQAVGGRINVFEANWLETGAAGTSDVSAFAPGTFDVDGSHAFVVYLGPPGRQTATAMGGTWSHVYLFAHGGPRTVRVFDADTGGQIVDETLEIEAGRFADVRVDLSTYDAMNQPATGRRPYLRVEADGPISVNTANWNDNWMAFATSPLPRDPEIAVVGPGTAEVGTVVRLVGSLTPTGAPPAEVLVDVEVPEGLTLVEVLIDGEPADSVEPDRAQSVLVDREAGAPIEFVAEVLVDAEAPAGEVLTVDVVAYAPDAEAPFGATASVGIQVGDPQQVALADLVVAAGDDSAALSWTASAGAGVAATLVVQRASQAEGPFVDLPASSQAWVGGGTDQRATLSWTDDTVSNGGAYYYRVRATTADGETFAGPVLARPADSAAPPAPSLTAAPGDGQVVLRFASDAADVTGYRLERSDDGVRGWQAVHAGQLSGPEWTDAGRTNGVTVYYRVIAFDDDGNQSVYSAVRDATPAAGERRRDRRLLAFEDMIGAGENDWDHNDFIVRVVTDEVRGGGGVAQIALEYEALARGAGYQHRFVQSLGLVGGWEATLTQYDADGSLSALRVQTGTGPLEIAVFDDTRTPLPPMVGNYANTALAQRTYVAGGRASLVVVLDDPAANLPEALGAPPYDLWLHLPFLPEPNVIRRPAWGGPVEATARHPELAGLPLDFVLELPEAEPAWPFEGRAMWHDFPDFVPLARGEPGAGPLVAAPGAAVFSEARSEAP